jgi:hypothetical protein
MHGVSRNLKLKTKTLVIGCIVTPHWNDPRVATDESAHSERIKQFVICLPDQFGEFLLRHGQKCA